MTRNRGFFFLAFFILIATPSISFAAAQVTGLQLVSSERVGRTSFNYTYRIQVKNDSPALQAARAIATSTSSSVVVVSGSVSLGNLAENTSITSTDTVTFRLDRAAAFDPATINWQITGGQTSTVAAALAQLEASGQIPILDRSASLTGPDTNNNGVRDDIDNYINSLPDTLAQKMALRQDARAITNAMLVGSQSNDEAVLRAATTQIGRSIHCIYLQYGSPVASKKASSIQKFVANTRLRFNAYIQFGAKISGTTARRPTGDSCEQIN